MAESGGNRLKLRNRLKLFSKKSFKIESFEFPSSELNNTFSGYCASAPSKNQGGFNSANVKVYFRFLFDWGDRASKYKSVFVITNFQVFRLKHLDFK